MSFEKSEGRHWISSEGAAAAFTVRPSHLSSGRGLPLRPLTVKRNGWIELNFRRWSSVAGGVSRCLSFQKTNAELTRKSSSTDTNTMTVDGTYLFSGILDQRFSAGGSGPKSGTRNYIL